MVLEFHINFYHDIIFILYTVCRCLLHVPTANPITTPAVDKNECTVKSTNIQFRYETEQELQLQFQRDYGNVSFEISNKSQLL